MYWNAGSRFIRLMPLSSAAMISVPATAPATVPRPPVIAVPPTTQPVMAVNSYPLPPAVVAALKRPTYTRAAVATTTAWRT